jgi:hypothetical protein
MYGWADLRWISELGERLEVDRVALVHQQCTFSVGIEVGQDLGKNV